MLHTTHQMALIFNNEIIFTHLRTSELVLCVCVCVCVFVCLFVREKERKKERKREGERGKKKDASERKMPCIPSHAELRIYCQRKGHFLILLFANTIAGVGSHKMKIFILKGF